MGTPEIPPGRAAASFEPAPAGRWRPWRLQAQRPEITSDAVTNKAPHRRRLAERGLVVVGDVEKLRKSQLLASLGYGREKRLHE